MSWLGAQAYRGQWTRCAIVLNINIEADPDVLPSLALGSAINGLILSRGQGAEPDNEYRKCPSHTFHITPPQFVADGLTGSPLAPVDAPSAPARRVTSTPFPLKP
jgi:hypothetical protein